MSDPNAMSDAASACRTPRGNSTLSRPLVGLTITGAQRPGVARFLSLAGTMAALVYSVPLPDETLELAPIFRPGAPDGREA